MTSHRATSVTGYPLVTMGMGIIALVLFLCRDALSFLQYDRAAMTAGEVWRGITGHWLHWSFDHFLWCTITFLAIGTICESISRKGYIATLAAAGIIIPVVSWFADPGLVYYRGLSGLASAIFVFAAVMMTRKAYARKDWPGIWLPAVAGIAFAGKVLFEYLSGSALFVDSPEIFSPVPLVHLAGGGTGLLMAFIFRKAAA
ncbi:MAG: rhombosortase [Desulforudis sp.]|nr:MAG: rhombosortase [Desulforudis sp.]